MGSLVRINREGDSAHFFDPDRQDLSPENDFSLVSNSVVLISHLKLNSKMI
jgi:hypothetical protein